MLTDDEQRALAQLSVFPGSFDQDAAGLARQPVYSVSDGLAESGIESTNIYGDWMWNAYHGIFEDYIAKADEQERYSLKNFLYDWLGQKHVLAQYWVVTTLDPPGDEHWEIVIAVPFQGDFFQEQIAYGVKRSKR